MEELERRLRERKTDSEETIRRRMLAARSEMERGTASYDYIIVNDDFERAYRAEIGRDRRAVPAGRVDLSGSSSIARQADRRSDAMTQRS